MSKPPKAAAKAVKPPVAKKPRSTETRAKQQTNLKPFPKGVSGNPAGRPKGSRNKLGEAFIEALHADFAEHGVTAIQKTREDDPAAYVRVIAGILPKELKIETTSDLTDEQLDARIRQLAAALEIGIGGTAGGATAQAEPHAAPSVSTLQ